MTTRVARHARPTTPGEAALQLLTEDWEATVSAMPVGTAAFAAAQLAAWSSGDGRQGGKGCQQVVNSFGTAVEHMKIY